MLGPGAHWGEAALASAPDDAGGGGAPYPHRATVRSLEPCVVLVLRRHVVEQRLGDLAPRVQSDWLNEAGRQRRLQVSLSRAWRLEQLERLPLLRPLPPPLLELLEAIGEYRLAPRGAALLRYGVTADTLFFVLRGAVALLDGGGAVARRLTEASPSRTLGAEAVVDGGRPCDHTAVVSSSPCQLFAVPLAELRRRHALHHELGRLLAIEGEGHHALERRLREGDGRGGTSARGVRTPRRSPRSSR
jgi:CRP-like cAMP-binding protein